MRMNEPRLHLVLIVLLALCGLIMLTRGQNITISNFTGLVTDADLEDLPVDAATQLRNLMPEGGRLVKTYGFGSKIDTAMSGIVYGLYTMQDDDLAMDAGADDRAYIAYTVDSNNRAMLYVWDGSAWDSLTVSKGHLVTDFPASYHVQGYNPVFQTGNTFRALPGAMDRPDGTHLGNGIWIGHIERDYFDGAYAPDTGWYGYGAAVGAAAIGSYSVTFGTTTAPGADLGNAERFYRISEVYDGLQEGLLSGYTYYPDDSTYLRRISMRIDTSFNKRITNIKLYRASTAEGDYGQLINAEFDRQDTPYETDSIRYGRHWFYLKGGLKYKTFSDTFNVEVFDSVNQTGGKIAVKILGDYEALFDSITYVMIDSCDSNSGYINIDSSAVSAGTTIIYGSKVPLWQHDTTGVGRIFDVAEYAVSSGDTFSFDSDQYNVPDSVFEINKTSTYWDFTKWGTTVKYNSAWKLCAQVVYPSPWVGNVMFHSVANGTGLYAGSTLVFLDTIYIDNVLAGDIFVGWDSLSYENTAPIERVIERNTSIVLDLYSARIGTTSEYNICKLLTARDGYYFFADSGSYYDLLMYDPDIPAGAAHYLAGETSIKTNGKFHLLAGGRAWLGDVVVDPDGENLQNDNILAYSESGKYDIFPSENLFRIGGYGGGGLTGLTEIFGNPVPMTRHTIKTVDIKSDPADPTAWRVIESAHNIGNVAERGYINVRGNVFITANDGWYMLSPNNLAETDQTPTSRLRISTPIQDAFDSLTVAQKAGVVCQYDQYNDEVIFCVPALETLMIGSVIINSEKAAFLDTLYPTTNYGANSRIYNYLIDDGFGGIAQCRRSILHFDLSGLDSIKNYIDSVSVQMYGIVDWSHNIYLHRMKTEWTETQASWDFRQSSVRWDSGGASGTDDYEFSNIGSGAFSNTSFAWENISLSVDAVNEMMGTSPSFANNGFRITGTNGYQWQAHSDDADSAPRMEIFYCRTRSGYFAYNISSGTWRQIRSEAKANIFSTDENGYAILYDSTDQKVYTIETPESTTASWGSKTFVVDNDNKLYIGKWIYLTYKSSLDSVNCYIYRDNETTAADTLVYPPASVPTTTRKYAKDVKGKKFKLVLEQQGRYSNDDFEIHKVEVTK